MMPSLTEKILHIQTLRAKGKDNDEIAWQLNLTPKLVLLYGGVDEKLLQRKSCHVRTVESIVQAVEDGCTSYDKIAQDLGKSPATVCIYARHYGIKLPVMRRPIKRERRFIRKPEIDEAIEQSAGFSGEEMAELVSPKITRERVRQYLRMTNQHEKWTKDRKEAKRTKKEAKRTREQVLSNLILALKARAYQLAKQEGWEYAQAFEYTLSRKLERYGRCATIPYENLVKLFRAYKEAKEKGERLSLREIAEKAEISNSIYIGAILKKTGLEPLCRKIESNVKYSDEEKEKIKKALNEGINCNDIAYFLERNPNYINQKFPEAKTGTGNVRGIIKRFGVYGVLRLESASKFLYAKDIGFTLEETCEYFGAHRMVVEYAWQNKKDIAKRILQTIEILRPERSQGMPYLPELI